MSAWTGRSSSRLEVSAALRMSASPMVRTLSAWAANSGLDGLGRRQRAQVARRPWRPGPGWPPRRRPAPSSGRRSPGRRRAPRARPASATWSGGSRGCTAAAVAEPSTGWGSLVVMPSPPCASPPAGRVLATILGACASRRGGCRRSSPPPLTGPCGTVVGVESVLRVAVVGTGVWGEQHARIFARRPDTDLVGRGRPRPGAYVGPRGRLREHAVHRRRGHARRRTPRPGHGLPAQRGPLRAHPRARARGSPAARREATGLRPRRGRRAGRRGGGTGPVLRHQLQPPLRRAVPAGQGGHRRRRARAAGLRHLAVRRRGQPRHQQAREPDRDPVPRLRHARAPARARSPPWRPR